MPFLELLNACKNTMKYGRDSGLPGRKLFRFHRLNKLLALAEPLSSDILRIMTFNRYGSDKLNDKGNITISVDRDDQSMLTLLVESDASSVDTEENYKERVETVKMIKTAAGLLTIFSGIIVIKVISQWQDKSSEEIIPLGHHPDDTNTSDDAISSDFT